MNSEHHPVDHKDDSAAYRTQIWAAVQQRIDSRLTPLASGTTFVGDWDVDADIFGNRQPLFRYNFHSSGAVIISTLQGNDPTPHTDTYVVRRDGQLTMSGETYHAAMAESGELVLFKGDSSLVLVAKRGG